MWNYAIYTLSWPFYVKRLVAVTHLDINFVKVILLLFIYLFIFNEEEEEDLSHFLKNFRFQPLFSPF